MSPQGLSFQFFKPVSTMTYREWITATLARFNMTAADVDLILANQAGAIPTPEGEVDVTVAKTALVREFANIIPMYNISEGGFSISWNWPALKAWYNITARQVGIDPIDLDAKPRPKIRNRSNVW